KTTSRPTGLLSLIVEKIPFFALTVILCFVTYFAQQDVGAMQHADALPLHKRVDNALFSYAQYVGKIVWPTNFAAIYPHPDSLPKGQVAMSAVLLLAITAFVVMQWRKRPFLAFGWFWFVGTLVPVIGLVQVGMQGMADHY